MAKDPHRPLDYLVLQIAPLRSAITGLPADTLGILLQLLIRCAVELNSGRIENAVATTQAPRCNIPGLWHWENTDLIIDIYPADYEAKAIAKRYSNAANATTRWKKPQTSPTACNGIQTTMPLYAKTDAIASPLMQSHANSCDGMQNSMRLHPCAPARGIDAYLYEGGKKEHTPEHTAPANLPHPPTNDKKFETWWRALAATHPSGKLLQHLPYDILTAAWSAYQTIPAAIDYAPLLRAYMADKLQKNKYGQRFYRASGIAKYFSTLADHINHAERWAAETGYYKKISPRCSIGRKEDAGGGAEPPTSEDLEQFFADIQQFKNPAAPQHAGNPTETPQERA